VLATSSAPPAQGPLLRLLATPHLLNGDQRRELPLNAPGLLLACLGLHGDWMPQERLILLFWPDASAADGQHHLRITLHRARQLLAGWGWPRQCQAKGAACGWRWNATCPGSAPPSAPATGPLR